MVRHWLMDVIDFSSRPHTDEMGFSYPIEHPDLEQCEFCESTCVEIAESLALYNLVGDDPEYIGTSPEVLDHMARAECGV